MTTVKADARVQTKREIPYWVIIIAVIGGILLLLLMILILWKVIIYTLKFIYKLHLMYSIIFNFLFIKINLIISVDSSNVNKWMKCKLTKLK